jgi:hypothetical protein
VWTQNAELLQRNANGLERLFVQLLSENVHLFTLQRQRLPEENVVLSIVFVIRSVFWRTRSVLSLDHSFKPNSWRNANGRRLARLLHVSSVANGIMDARERSVNPPRKSADVQLLQFSDLEYTNVPWRERLRRPFKSNVAITCKPVLQVLANLARLERRPVIGLDSQLSPVLLNTVYGRPERDSNNNSVAQLLLNAMEANVPRLKHANGLERSLSTFKERSALSRPRKEMLSKSSVVHGLNNVMDQDARNFQRLVDLLDQSTKFGNTTTRPRKLVDQQRREREPLDAQRRRSVWTLNQRLAIQT